MSKTPTRGPKKATPPRSLRDDDALLDAALRDVDRLVESFDRRWNRARERCERVREGSASKPRALSARELAWGDLEAAWRLRDAINAAVAKARAEAAISEAYAAVAILRAFEQFAGTRASRRSSIAAMRAGAGSRRGGQPRSTKELTALALKAKRAVVHVIVYTNRLAEALAEARELTVEARRTAAAVIGDADEDERLRQRFVVPCERAEAYLERQHAVSAAVVDQLMLGLRSLFETLPPSVAAKFAGRRDPGRATKERA